MNILLEYAKSFLGVPYLFGGRNRLEGLDCSQYVIELLISSGILPHGTDTNAQGLLDYLEKHSVSDSIDPQPGAIAFYGKDSHSIVHVAFCIDNNTMIEAGGGDHTTTSLGAAVKKSACVRMRPVKYRKDYFCCLMPNYAVNS